MPRPARTDSQATRRGILDAAEAEFARVGLRGATLEHIAGLVGIRRPSLLYYFPTKELLYRATVERTFGALRAALVSAMGQQGNFEARVRACVRSFAMFVELRPAAASVILREIVEAGPGRAALRDQLAPLVTVVSDFIIREGGSRLRAGLPVRAAIMQIASGLLLRAAADELREPLWGTEDHAEALAVALLLEGAG